MSEQTPTEQTPTAFSSDGLMNLVPQIDLPEGYPNLRTGDPDRLGALADWWATVSQAPYPERVTLAWGEVPGPGEAPVVLAELDRAADDIPGTVAEAFTWGAGQADRAVDGGTDLIVLTLPPEEQLEDGHLPVHLLLAAHLLQIDAVEATPWPEQDGLTDAGWMARVAALRDGRRQIRGIYGEPQRLLETLAAPRIAAAAGLLARATARRTPTLLDGAAAATCGLLVRRAEAASRAWWQATDAGAGSDAVHDRVMKELRLTPLLRLGLESGRRTLPTGIGGRLGLAVLETALRTAPEAPPRG